MPPKKPSPLAQIKSIENDPVVQSLIAEHLPPNYDFEIPKTVWRIRRNPDCKTVALQFPEGLLIFSTRIGKILQALTQVDVILMGDITYGACCVDDHTASMLGADLLVHYGHSCLVPVAVANRLDTIYVFVTIKFNLELATSAICNVVRDKLRGRIGYEQDCDSGGGGGDVGSLSCGVFRVWLVSTIQFANSLGPLKEGMEAVLNAGAGGVRVQVDIPRSKPLSGGEILGCTAPRIDGDLIFYVGDGRFHLEAMMMANKGVEAYRYDPYNTTVTHESFNHTALSTARTASLSRMQRSPGHRIGIILGTLGRQGNPKPMDHVYKLLLSAKFTPFVILMSEVMPAKLALFGPEVSGWVQFACPRLSIDWGDAFTAPVLTSYEATLLAKGDFANYQHPMDYYAYESGGSHTPNHVAAI